MLFVGGFNPRKNIGNLLRAFSLISDSFPHDLVIAGFKRWKYAQDFKLIDQLGLQSRIHKLGFVPDADLVAIYNMADLFVFPSLYEGFGIPSSRRWRADAQSCRPRPAARPKWRVMPPCS